MALPGSSGFSFPTGDTNGSARSLRLPRFRVTRHRLGIPILLFALTLITTSAVGSRLAYNFEHNLPAFHEEDLTAVFQPFTSPSLMLAGLPFSLTLLMILLAHELGHYVACRYYRVDATLPYFLPAPTLIGTLGAFIRIRSPIYSKRVLFDVGIAGPIAGFVFLIPPLAIGLAFSKIIPGIAHQGDLVFGTPGALRVLEAAIFPGVPSADIYLHPVARAAWVGLLATALNLLPIGQLDGGHILYSFVGERHRLLSRLFVAALIPVGFFFSYSWLLWAAFLLLFGMRHPSIYDTSPMGPGRSKLGLLALVMFVLSFTLIPVRAGSGF